jgi:hypothetical protein
MAQSQSGNLFAPAEQVRIVADKERRDPVLDSGRQGCFDLVLGAGADNNSLQPEAARRCLYRLVTTSKRRAASVCRTYSLPQSGRPVLGAVLNCS